MTKVLTDEEVEIICKKKCIRPSFYCEDCPMTRTGKRDRKAYFQRYYQEVTKKKKQEARANENKS